MIEVGGKTYKEALEMGIRPMMAAAHYMNNNNID